MMDATFTACARLREQAMTIEEIARRLNISHGKVTKILVTIGEMQTEESSMLAMGMTVEQIMERTGKSRQAVMARLPYEKGMYGSEYPSRNALKIRKCREKKGDD